MLDVKGVRGARDTFVDFCITSSMPAKHKILDKMLVHNDYIKTNNTYIIIDLNVS